MANFVNEVKQETTHPSLPEQCDDSAFRQSVMAACTLVQATDLQADQQQLISAFHVLLQWQFKFLHELAAVAAELTDDSRHRQALDRSVRKAERESARTRLPLRFWRIEKPGDVEHMLRRRALFLAREHRVCLDDAWDLLCEFCRDWLRISPPTDLLSEILSEAYRKEETPDAGTG